MKKFNIVGLDYLKASVVFLGLFALLAFAHPHQLSASLFVDQDNNTGAPLIEISPSVVEAGIVKPEDSVQAEYSVINKGTADLVIKRVAPT